MQTPASDSALCEFLPWDSSFFGVNIARLRPHRLTGDILTDALKWCDAQRIQCLYFLADPESSGTIELAETRGFHLVDVRVTLEHKPVPAESPSGADTGGIRLYRPDDLERLKSIARTNHFDSRFFVDRRFPQGRAEALFEVWIERSCAGWAQAVLVADLDGAAAGYTTCHIDAAAGGSIGLVGLAPEARGRGLGGKLIQAALGWFQGRGAARITVVTQGKNVRAQRLYQKNGFVTESLMLWYHRWAEQP